jgi:glutathione S-transferase
MSPIPSLTVHHLESSRSQRILWLLEELGLPYELVRYRRDPKTMRADPALKALHPLGKSPVVTLGDGQVLAESGAIIEYFVEATGKLAPPAGTPERQLYRHWLHYAEGSLMPPLLVKLITGQIRAAPVPFFLRPITRQIADKVDKSFTDAEILLHFDYLEQALDGKEFFVGSELSGADIQLSYGVRAGLARGAVGERPRLRAWVERMMARPAYVRAVEKGGEDTLIG